MKTGKRIMAFLACFMLTMTGWIAGFAAEGNMGPLAVQDGMLQPVFNYTDPVSSDYTNEGNDLLRFCVWVETDYDTDGDGKDDLVKVLVQVPRAAAEGKYKAAVIYDPTPYYAGCLKEYEESAAPLYTEEPFNYEDLYRHGEKRTPAGTRTTLEQAQKANIFDWLYEIQDPFDTPMWGGITSYDYYLVRGFAVVEAAGIGTYGSEGFELCGMDLERDSHKNVIEWLTGDRRAFTDRTGNIEIKADWCNGNVAMTGASYGGTIPFEVAVSGVKGLKTIIPFAGIANWYDYTNSQGVPLRNKAHYADGLAAYNAGGTFQDAEMKKVNPRYGSWLWQIAKDQEETNGDYAPIWERLDYTVPEKNHIDCSALVVTGMNDYNVNSRQADLMVKAFRQAGKTVKLVLHQDGHCDLDNLSINGTPWQNLMNKWLSHYLYGVENDAESFPEVLAENNVNGHFDSYEGWNTVTPKEFKAKYTGETTEVSSVGLGQFTLDYQENHQSNMTEEMQEDFYLKMQAPLTAVYPLEMPENTTIFGVPEIHVKLSGEAVDLDGLMITALLLDVSDQGEFPAYRIHTEDGGLVPKQTTGATFVQGGGLSDEELMTHVQEKVPAQRVTLGWTDLQNPGKGSGSSEYTLQEDGLELGVSKEYTFYMMPVVYTLAPGHHLELRLMTWDPFRVFLDQSFDLDASLETKLDSYDYGYTIDNASLKVLIPTAEAKK